MRSLQSEKREERALGAIRGPRNNYRRPGVIRDPQPSRNPPHRPPGNVRRDLGHQSSSFQVRGPRQGDQQSSFNYELNKISTAPADQIPVFEVLLVLAKLDPEKSNHQTFASLALIIQRELGRNPDERIRFAYELHCQRWIYYPPLLEGVLLRGRLSDIRCLMDCIAFLDSLLQVFTVLVETHPECHSQLPVDQMTRFFADFLTRVNGSRLTLALKPEETQSLSLARKFPERAVCLAQAVQTIREMESRRFPARAPPVPSTQTPKDELSEDGFTDPERLAEFRTKNLFLTPEDLEDQPPRLLRLRLKSNYTSLDDYLGRQFSVLLEDFYASVRAGIREFRTHRTLQPGKQKFEGLTVHSGEIVGQVATNQGVCFILRLFLGRRFHLSVRRFLHGSLLIFSKDEFKTMAIGILKDKFELAVGARGESNHLDLVVEPKFPVASVNMTIADFKGLSVHVAETSNFFEAYYHCLRNLQALRDLPLAHLLVEGRLHLNLPPVYAQVDLPALLHAPALLYQELALRQEPQKSVDDAIKKVLKNVTLDQSQRAAVVETFRRELTIIQGPPGTGKTFVSVLVVRILLQLGTRVGGPIFIICYTNHALDQFLTHIQKYTNSIVRLGGRCKTEALEKYTLASLKAEEKIPKCRKAGWLHSQRISTEKEYNQMASAHQTMSALFLPTEKLYLGSQAHLFSQLIQSYESRCEKMFSNEKDDRFEEYLGARLQGVPRLTQALLEWLGLLDLGFLRREWKAESKNKPENWKWSKYHWISKGGVKEEEGPLRHGPDKVEAEEAAREMRAEAELFERQIENILDGSTPTKSSTETLHCNPFLQSRPVTDLHRCYKTNKTMIFGERTKELSKAGSPDDENLESFRDDFGASRDILRLSLREKWLLMDRLVSQGLKLIERKLPSLELELKSLTDQAKRLDDENLAFYLRSRAIVGMTTNGAAKMVELLRAVPSRVTIVEEAAEVLESQIVTALTHSLKHLILVGDHMQLRPKVNEMEIGSKYRLEISLFERLVVKGFPKALILHQRRMRPEIADLIRLFYPDLKDDPSVSDRPPVRGIPHNVFFFAHNWAEDPQEGLKESRKNTREALFIVRFAEYLLQQGYSSSQMAILSLYAGQLLFIKRELGRDPRLAPVRVSTVDDFQGEENELILLSLVRSNPQHNIGFLKFDNRINVAFSRARTGLFVFGDPRCIRGYFQRRRAQNPQLLLFKMVLHLEARGCLGPRLPLICQAHQTETRVASVADFNRVPEGGCSQKCLIRLPCGHSCKRMCHPFQQTLEDPSGHAHIRCYEPCAWDHPCEHSCQLLCFSCQSQDHKCTGKVNMIGESCGHSYTVECFDRYSPEATKCRAKCSKTLPCGHPCYRLCWESCEQLTPEQIADGFETSCKFGLKRQMPCGHEARVSCGINFAAFMATKKCSEKCRAALDCGHNCSGSCHECQVKVDGLLEFVHQSCKSKCGKTLFCGHECREECSGGLGCGPCPQECQLECSHGRLEGNCGDLSPQCHRDCQNQCPHRKCVRFCWEECSVGPCTEPCPKKLRCGHPCLGGCGEACPDLCFICDSKNPLIKDLPKGWTPGNSVFVELGCSHLFARDRLDHHLLVELPKSNKLVYPACPQCGLAIFTCWRYQSAVKKVAQSVSAIQAEIERKIVVQSAAFASLDPFASIDLTTFKISIHKMFDLQGRIWPSLLKLSQKNLFLSNFRIEVIRYFVAAMDLALTSQPYEAMLLMAIIRETFDNLIKKPASYSELAQAANRLECVSLYIDLVLFKSRNIDTNLVHFKSVSDTIYKLKQEKCNWPPQLVASTRDSMRQQLGDGYFVEFAQRCQSLKGINSVPDASSGKWWVCQAMHPFATQTVVDPNNPPLCPTCPSSNSRVLSKTMTVSSRPQKTRKLPDPASFRERPEFIRKRRHNRPRRDRRQTIEELF